MLKTREKGKWFHLDNKNLDDKYKRLRLFIINIIYNL